MFLFMFVFTSCDKELKIYKDEMIVELDIYYDTLNSNYLKYSDIFIKNEIKIFKELILKAKSKEEVEEFKKSCINEIEKLILDDSDYTTIMNTYSTWKYHDCNSDIEPQLKYYFGKYNSKYVVIISGPNTLIRLDEYDYYYVAGTEGIYKFDYMPEFIGVCFNGSYYTLDNAVNFKVLGEEKITGSQVDKIYERYLMLNEYKK